MPERSHIGNRIHGLTNMIQASHNDANSRIDEHLGVLTSTTWQISKRNKHTCIRKITAKVITRARGR